MGHKAARLRACVLLQVLGSESRRLRRRCSAVQCGPGGCGGLAVHYCSDIAARSLILLQLVLFALRLAFAPRSSEVRAFCAWRRPIARCRGAVAGRSVVCVVQCGDRGRRGRGGTDAEMARTVPYRTVREWE